MWTPSHRIGIASDRRSAVVAKAHEYLGFGLKLVWLVDPPSRTITIFRADGTVEVLGRDETIDGEDVLPGFRSALRDVFQLQER